MECVIVLVVVALMDEFGAKPAHHMLRIFQTIDVDLDLVQMFQLVDLAEDVEPVKTLILGSNMRVSGAARTILVIVVHAIHLSKPTCCTF